MSKYFKAIANRNKYVFILSAEFEHNLLKTIYEFLSFFTVKIIN